MTWNWCLYIMAEREQKLRYKRNMILLFVNVFVNNKSLTLINNILSHKKLEMHGWVISTVATDALVLTLPWRHNQRDGISNHQSHDCLLNHLFRCRSKKTSKLRVTGLCVGNSPVTSEFPAQRASDAENVSIWWRHHESNSSVHHCSWLLMIRDPRCDQVISLPCLRWQNCPNSLAHGRYNYNSKHVIFKIHPLWMG